MTAKLKLVSSRAAPKRAARRRKKKPAPKNLDHAFIAGTLLEVQSIYGEGEANFAYRHRVRLRNKGGIAENLYDYGAHEYLCGDVQECIGVNKWSKPTFGMIPTAHLVCIREIVEDEPKRVTTIKGDKQ